MSHLMGLTLGHHRTEISGGDLPNMDFVIHVKDTLKTTEDGKDT